MAPRTFWSIFLKLLGIYAVLDSVSIIPQIISYLIYYKSSDTSGYLIEALLLLIIIIGIFWLIIRLTVFKTDWLIDKLHLDNNFTEEKIDINIDRHGLLNVAIIVIGGVLFIDSLPLFLKDLYEYFQRRGAYIKFSQDPKFGWLIYYLVKILLGSIFMTNSRFVVGLIEKKEGD